MSEDSFLCADGHFLIFIEKTENELADGFCVAYIIRTGFHFDACVQAEDVLILPDAQYQVFVFDGEYLIRVVVPIEREIKAIAEHRIVERIEHMGNPPWGMFFPKDDEIPVCAEIQSGFDALQLITSIFNLP